MSALRILITAGPTREPIDAVRYIGNRSSGQMGAALAEASITAGHKVMLIVGPVGVSMPDDLHRIDIETAAQMQSAVLEQFQSNDLLIMAAAVADFRPKSLLKEKLNREGTLTIECEPTEDIVASAAAAKRADQRIIGFSLESSGGIERAREKLNRKKLDLIVYNPIETMNSSSVSAVLLYAGGATESLPVTSKAEFGHLLISRVPALFLR
jgi:phosphopantothenoylcysteine decarboxylase / phosphopantothenate---cysteine ligase